MHTGKVEAKKMVDIFKNGQRASVLKDSILELIKKDKPVKASLFDEYVEKEQDLLN